MSHRQQARRQPAPHQPTSATPNKGAERPSSVSEGSQTAQPAPAPAAGPVRAVVVFGTDATGKPRAAYFEAAYADLAAKAAGLMQLHTLPVTTAEERELAAKLPAGKIYESGRGFVPFIRRDLYDRLIALPTQAQSGANGTACVGDSSAQGASPASDENKTGTKPSDVKPPQVIRFPADGVGWDSRRSGTRIG